MIILVPNTTDIAVQTASRSLKKRRLVNIAERAENNTVKKIAAIKEDFS
jgi:hypothetical protein